MATVCVHGLGHIGLPAATMLATNGFDVTGYDIDDALLDRLENRNLPVEEPDLAAAVERALDGSLSISRQVVPADYHLICVPTPLAEDGRANLGAVEAAGAAVAEVLREGDLVLLESTVPPGTTVETLAPVLERSGLAAGEFSLAYSPETVLPGNVIAELRDNDRVIAGIDERSVERAALLYDSFVEGELRTTTDPTLAEFVKLIQNTFRDTNIALANELATIARDYGIDSREAIELANHHPRVNLHQPGPGVGGHCIPIDPLFLGHRSDRLDLIERARAVNDGMAEYVVELLDAHLDSFESAAVAVLGVAYKGNVGDARESPGLRVADRLRSRASARHTARTRASVGGSGAMAPGSGSAGSGANAGGGASLDDGVGADDGASRGTENGRNKRGASMSAADADETGVDVRLHDPHVEDPTIGLRSIEDALSGADAAVIATDHNEYEDLDPASVAERMDGRVVVDGKALLDAGAWERAGFVVDRI